ncbi:MAG: hypothetical protein K8F24_12610, partial [Bacteroidales bacterium]|nr:hypothetical protein [Bacteroidales bacterium]
MKKLNLILISITLGLAACSTSGSVYDDVYYSRSSKSEPAPSSDNNLATAAPEKNYTAATVKSSNNYDYETYYEEDAAQAVAGNKVDPVYETTETVTETDGTTYTTTETYYDSDYASRVKRFGSGASSNFGYYDEYNSGYNNYGGSNIYVGVGYPYGWSLGFSYGWPYYGSYYPYGRRYYDPFFYDPWYSWGYG